MNKVIERIKTNKKIVISVLLVLLAVIIFVDGNNAEDTAEKFVEAMLDGNAKTAVSLMSDITIEESGYQTKKLLIHAVEERLENSRERYKDKYGSSWKYKLNIVDTYDVDFSEIEDYVDVTDYASENIKEVLISVKHKGSGLFNSKEGSEDIAIICVKQGRKWYVLSFEQKG